MLLKKLSPMLFALGLTGLTACTMVTDDLPPCPAKLSVRFVYDYNLKFADAFPHEVKSVSVWAFHHDGGTLAWSGAASGEALTEEGFTMETTLGGGTYDFVAWCGLEDNAACTLATYKPASKEELVTTLNTTTDADGTRTAETYNPGLYHGCVSAYDYVVKSDQPSIACVTIPLTKDNNDLRVMLQHLDGSAIESKDFSVTITDGNWQLAWDNAVAAGSPQVCYKPWNVRYGATTRGGDKELPCSRTDITSVATLLSEFSTSRLMADSNATLTVHRKTDDRDIIRIPLIDYLLLVKGHYGEMSDQEYLDREDDYSMLFFIDSSSNWYTAGGIVINSWTVVPPQESPF